MSGPVGPRGLTVLVFAGMIGLCLAAVGWTQRGTGLVAPSVGGLGGSATGHTAGPPPASPAARASETPTASATP
ncbi:MAG TPA: hypothetical protein VED20_17355, partial [Streptosporangiaceae bacterium]|nr:hypothetical protein [Streptosporangiaceae bacterium]